MALTVGNLDSYFTNLISSLMVVERQPLTRLQASRDQVSVQRGVYSDLNGKLQELQSAAQALRNATDTELTVGRKAVVSNAPSGSTVLTASAASSALTSTYQISVSQLAREHRVWSDQQATADQALGLAGAFTLNGVEITAEATDSLNAIATKINAQAYASGSEVVASVVDRRLVVAAKNTGAAGSLTANETTGTVLQSLGILEDNAGQLEFVSANQQTARDAVFTIDGVQVTRSRNTGLTDVLDGLTLNLAPDAEGKVASLTVSPDTAAARTAIEAFVDKFNSVQDYLNHQTAVTSTVLNGVKTYSRGPLAGEGLFGDLRGDLFTRFLADGPAGGAFASLRSIGITLDDNLRATISDGDALDAALSANLTDARALFENVAGGIDSLLGGFTGATGGYLKTVLQSMETQLAETDVAIADLNVRLAERQQSLIDQFGQMQALLIQMSYQQQQWSSIYGSFSQSG
jgi:flagellar hook-associated protein 2